MKKIIIALLLVSCISCKNDAKKNTKEEVTKPLTSYIDPFIGTAGHGHTYPGATVPFGMLQVSPVNGISKWDWCSGYHYTDDVMVGFGHLTLSGTGIGDLNDVLMMPVTKKIDLNDLRKEVKDRKDILYSSKYSHDKETASAGYYSVYLETPKVQAEVTASKRTGYHRYTFEKGATQSVVIDLGFAINWDKPTKGHISFKDKNIITGYRYSTGWAKNQKVFFAIKFSKPIAKIHNLPAPQEKVITRCFFGNETSNVLEVKVAISSVSEDNALENLDENTNFDEAKEKAEKLWAKKLKKIEVETPSDSLKTIFYTALYHSQVAPVTFSDKNGQFRLGNDSIVTAKNYTAYSTLSLWDTFRAEHPLLTLIEPEKVPDMISSMLAYYGDTKRLPVWTLYGNETNCMTGYHSIPVIVDAYLKGIHNFDVEKAYEAMKATMMQDDRGLKHYKKYGYIPYELLDESVTITLEYAFDDWCIAQMAKSLGKDDDYKFFTERSKAYKHLFDKKTGFMRGKSKDGKSWHEPFDPKRSNHREHTDYTEGNAYQHSWFVPHNVPEFIEINGGKEKFIQRLEKLFTESSEITGDNVSVDISGLIGQYAHGNEPSHHIAYLFNEAGQPWRTQYWVNHILNTQYDATPNGLSGNEDCGQMSAWYVMSAMGLYPLNPASGVYQITSPLFEKVTLNLQGGVSFEITAENVSKENIYIQSATLNGKPFNQTTITHQQLLKGGKLHFVLGKTPNKEWAVEQ
ncbi:MAG: GH92 family glycosyl hydrolase [Flavobacteriaceae bacterium]|nr:GH92 family glycosyl hydrolase [Flavobacteriaceae bacterium]